jgi:hypothetical protein
MCLAGKTRPRCETRSWIIATAGTRFRRIHSARSVPPFRVDAALFTKPIDAARAEEIERAAREAGAVAPRVRLEPADGAIGLEFEVEAVHQLEAERVARSILSQIDPSYRWGIGRILDMG